jgi:3-oxoacyl-[acyl-carrier-protein] synthase II
VNRSAYADGIAITGVGAVTPLGATAESSFAALLRGESGIRVLDPAPRPDIPVRIGGQIQHAASGDGIPGKQRARHARYTHFALAAAREAITQSGLGQADYDPDRIGVVFGTGMGGIEFFADAVETLRERGARRISPFATTAIIPNIAAGMIGEAFSLMGPNFAVASACATGGHAIAQGAALLRLGQVDAVLVGASEAPLIDISLGCFSQIRALSLRNDAPRAASRPFDMARDGFVMSEGGAALVLERMDDARARGAVVLAELAGCGASADAYHVTRPREDGTGAIRAMRAALRDAGMSPQDIDYVNAHGTGTPANDLMESLALRAVFGDQAQKPWVSATKSMLGHMLGAAGAFEAVVSVLSIVHGAVHPTINLACVEPACDFDLVPHEARRRPVRGVLSNSFAFGGQNVSLVFCAP